jgi:hypothetical protein
MKIHLLFASLAALLIGHAPLRAAVIANASALDLSASAGVHTFPIHLTDTDSRSQGTMLNPLAAKTFLRDESGSDFAEAFSHAQTSWIDANSGTVTFRHGWSTSITSGGEVSGVGVNSAQDTGWLYDFTLSNIAKFVINYEVELSGSDTLGMPVLSIYHNSVLIDTVLGSDPLSGQILFTLNAGSHSVRIRPSGGLTGHLGVRDALQDTTVNWNISEEGKPGTKPTLTPEPASLAIWTLALAGLGLTKFRRRSAQRIQNTSS